MKNIYLNQVGFLTNDPKKAVLNFSCESFNIVDACGKVVYSGKTEHFGTDDISGEDATVAKFDDFKQEGIYTVEADGAKSVSFAVSKNAYDKLMEDLCKCYYFLRCGDALEEKYAGVYMHKPCHTALAKVYGQEDKLVDVSGGWHDAGDYGRYSTAGAVAVAHLLYGVKFFENLKEVKFDIPKVGKLPDILAEVMVELDFLMKMQKEDGGVWHKVTTYNHAGFVMPEDDTADLFLFPVSSIATADIAAVFALASSVYEEYGKEYSKLLMEKALLSYDWLVKNPEALLFKNAPGSNTGEYGEAEDFSNRFWAAASLYEVTGEKKYLEDALVQKSKVEEFDKQAKMKGYLGDVMTCLGWAEVAGLGSFALLLKNDDNDITKELKERFIKEADRLCVSATKNGFGLCMEAKDFIWGSNMELGKYLMMIVIANKLAPSEKYVKAISDGMDYLLGCNTMDTSYVTGNGEKAYKNPHLRPTAIDDIEQPWPGLVSGGPNVGLQDERAKEVPAGSAPMKCYLDHIDCYSLNEITIYWNSPFIFVLAAMLA